MGLLNKDLIVLDADVKTAEDCIRLSSGLFFELGFVKEGYADAVLEREKVYPTGLPGKDIGIAIPHTNNTLVKKPGIGVIVPKEPVTFCMMGTKDKTLQCELILPLVIQDSKMQVTMLKRIMKIIQDGELLKKIRDARSKDEIVGYLNSLEE